MLSLILVITVTTQKKADDLRQFQKLLTGRLRLLKNKSVSVSGSVVGRNSEPHYKVFTETGLLTKEESVHSENVGVKIPDGKNLAGRIVDEKGRTTAFITKGGSPFVEYEYDQLHAEYYSLTEKGNKLSNIGSFLESKSN